MDADVTGRVVGQPRWHGHPYNRAALYRLVEMLSVLPRGLRLGLARRVGQLAPRFLPVERRAIRKALGSITGAAGGRLDELTAALSSQAEALSMLNHHDGRVGHVDADLDHRRCHQDLGFVGGKRGHRLVLRRTGHAPMQQADDTFAEGLRQVRMTLLGRRELGFLVALDQRADPVDLRPFGYVGADALDNVR